MRFVPNSSNLRTHGKYNSNKKVKPVVKIDVSDQFYVWFWFCRRMNNWIIRKVNSNCSWECLIDLWINLDGCTVEGKIKIDHNMLIWDICILENSCLLIRVGRRRNKWHTAIFEVEGECCLRGYLKKNNLVNYDACEYLLGGYRSGQLVIL